MSSVLLYPFVLQNNEERCNCLLSDPKANFSTLHLLITQACAEENLPQKKKLHVTVTVTDVG